MRPSLFGAAVVAGPSHLILGAGSTSRIIMSQLVKLRCVDTLYKPLEKLDVIALGVVEIPLDMISI